ncbi:hypothetical protein GCWU000342_02154 [Shuttleworthella satelles DSM 14600]|uniref:Uncharacterized protein n=1 Tax=Shuttleworthella satelles DSM 14600 TaxID=626523 RepID=C4GDI1_9FIRM|nr:hypothetical protein GCWU000342_02154 [Shuttleworthia satelles DSM 14600]
MPCRLYNHYAKSPMIFANHKHRSDNAYTYFPNSWAMTSLT